jgi:hypothetical protein
LNTWGGINIKPIEKIIDQLVEVANTIDYI